jgi:hypothetical protein
VFIYQKTAFFIFTARNLVFVIFFETNLKGQFALNSTLAQVSAKWPHGVEVSILILQSKRGKTND